MTRRPPPSHLVVSPHWRTRMTRRPPLAGSSDGILALLVDLGGGVGFRDVAVVNGNSILTLLVDLGGEGRTT